MKNQNATAIVLAAGQGKRMETSTQKQYLELSGYPILYYSLKAFEKSLAIKEIILVTGEDEISYCQKEIVEQYGFQKVTHVVSGGKERYDSVWFGMQYVSQDSKYVFIHDAARPMINETIIQNGLQCVQQYGTAVAGMPSKDTVKILDNQQFVTETPDRANVWVIQTPQIVEKEMVYQAYKNMMEQEHSQVTDDAMVVETYLKKQVKIFEASYYNIKITTPEDLELAEVFLQKGQGEN